MAKMSIFNKRVKESYNLVQNLLGASIWRLCAIQTKTAANGYSYRIYPQKRSVSAVRFMDNYAEFTAGNETFVVHNGDLISATGSLAGQPVKGITDWSHVAKEAEALRDAIKSNYKKVVAVEISSECYQARFTKDELRYVLEGGSTLMDLFEFRSGQECEIFKANRFVEGDEVIYIPDLSLNNININRPIEDSDELDDIMDHCYTGNDFLAECSGDRKLAERLFCYVDWQNPSSALPEVEDEKDDG